MMFVAPPPSVQGLGEALTLLRALDSVEHQRELLAQFDDYLTRAHEAHAEYAAAKEEAEARIAAANEAVTAAAEQTSTAQQMLAVAEQKQAAVDADRAAFEQRRNAEAARLTTLETQLEQEKAALKDWDAEVTEREQAAIAAKDRADKLAAELQTKLASIASIAA